MKRLLLGLLGLVLASCGVGNSGPYQQKNGHWFFESHGLDLPPGETLTPLNNRFARSRTLVFYREARIEGADAATLQALDDSWSKDGAHVWWSDVDLDSQPAGALVEGADPASFVVEPGSGTEADAHDARGVWQAGKPVSAPVPPPLP